jgi:hypothetical protein
MSHPLRPKENYILVCEGPSDLQLLQSILQKFVPDLTVYYAEGGQNVKPLANVLKSSYYIIDRDFKKSYAEATKTLKSKEPQTIWPRHDIECYLLYPDWLLGAIRKIQEARNFRSPPSSEQDIGKSIIEIADSFIADHAGRKTLDTMSKTAGKRNIFDAKPDKSIVQGGAEASDRKSWESCLVQETDRICQAAQSLGNNIELTQTAVLKLYDEQVEQYTQWAQNITTIRDEFSGKRVLQALAQKWGTPGGKSPKTKPWQLLRNIVIEEAIDYNHHISKLNENPRLGDFGNIAKKITGNDV